MIISFHIDADEYPHDTLLSQLKQILEINDVDLLWIPRVNTIEGLLMKMYKMGMENFRTRMG